MSKQTTYVMLQTNVRLGEHGKWQSDKKKTGFPPGFLSGFLSGFPPGFSDYFFKAPKKKKKKKGNLTQM
jgi:hypothetical protein